MQSALEQLGTECSIEEVMVLCPELTCNQVCIVIDYLSRAGGTYRPGLLTDRAHRTDVQTRGGS